MGDARDTFEAIGEMVEDNTSDSGVDIVNVFGTLIEALKENSEMTIESWELFQLSIKNSADIASNMIDDEIARLRSGT